MSRFLLLVYRQILSSLAVRQARRETRLWQRLYRESEAERKTLARHWHKQWLKERLERQRLQDGVLRKNGVAAILPQPQTRVVEQIRYATEEERVTQLERREEEERERDIREMAQYVAFDEETWGHYADGAEYDPLMQLVFERAKAIRESNSSDRTS